MDRLRQNADRKTAGKQKKLFEYDWIRFAAMICIFVFHFNSGLTDHGCALQFLYRYAGRNLTIGQQGVTLFFILSGATSALSMERMLNRGAQKTNIGAFAGNALAYYWKRIKAMYPPFWIAWIFAYVLLIMPDSALSRTFFLTVLGMDGYAEMSGVATAYLVGEWFLGAILILYLLLPFLFLLVKKFPVPAAVGIVLFYILYFWFYPFSRMQETDALLRIPEFAFGIYFYLYIKKVDWRAAIISAAVFLVAAVTPIAKDNLNVVLVQGISAFLWMAWLGRFLGERKSVFAKVFRRVIQSVAGLSYGVFLLHHVIMEQIIGRDNYFQNITDFQGYLGVFFYSFALVIAGAVFLNHAKDAFNPLFSLLERKSKGRNRQEEMNGRQQ
ncbi:MAG: acyltransferase [Parasporobacterium sp.]|nr:acyltransferase [Parasporobacterium sp.]